MKATGIIRRIDDLGRIVIPRDIRRTMHIAEGDPLEIFVEDDMVIFKKYSPVKSIKPMASKYAKFLYRTCNSPVIICDKDSVVVAAGLCFKLQDHILSTVMKAIIGTHEPYIASHCNVKPIEELDYYISVSYPILTDGEMHGVVCLLQESETEVPTEEKIAFAKAVAFLMSDQLKI